MPLTPASARAAWPPRKAALLCAATGPFPRASVPAGVALGWPGACMRFLHRPRSVRVEAVLRFSAPSAAQWRAGRRRCLYSTFRSLPSYADPEPSSGSSSSDWVGALEDALRGPRPQFVTTGRRPVISLRSSQQQSPQQLEQQQRQERQQGRRQAWHRSDLRPSPDWDATPSGSGPQRWSRKEQQECFQRDATSSDTWSPSSGARAETGTSVPHSSGDWELTPQRWPRKEPQEHFKRGVTASDTGSVSSGTRAGTTSVPHSSGDWEVTPQRWPRKEAQERFQRSETASDTWSPSSGMRAGTGTSIPHSNGESEVAPQRWLRKEQQEHFQRDATACDTWSPSSGMQAGTRPSVPHADIDEKNSLRRSENTAEGAGWSLSGSTAPPPPTPPPEPSLFVRPRMPAPSPASDKGWALHDLDDVAVDTAWEGMSRQSKSRPSPNSMLLRKEPNRLQTPGESAMWGRRDDDLEKAGAVDLHVPAGNVRGPRRTAERDSTADMYENDPIDKPLPVAGRLRVKAEGIEQIIVPEVIKLNAFAAGIKKSTEAVLRTARRLGMEMTAEHILTQEEASNLALEFGVEPIFIGEAPEFDLHPRPPPDNPSSIPIRPPVVTIMGHVDHGKTTLLDALRSSNIVEQEAGRITQHIGAFSVTLPSKGKPITFLDTPGHAAFSAMRKRGANVTDIVVLVVAADDGVMPQTREAIRYALEAKVPIIVAINKCDLGVHNLEKLFGDLLICHIHLEHIGGDVPAVQISALNKTGLDVLEENIFAVAEMTDIRAEVDGPVEGYVIENQQSKGMGPVVTVLVKRGTLKVGDVLVAGTSWCRVRMMVNDLGTSVKTASPGTPVKVSGWKSLPEVGDQVLQAEGVDQATRVVKARNDFRSRRTMSDKVITAMNAGRLEQSQELAENVALTQLYKKAVRSYYKGARTVHPSLPDGYVIRRGVVKKTDNMPSTLEGKKDEEGEEDNPADRVVKVMIKADVSGSAEAIVDALQALPQHIVSLQILSSAVGPVTSGDVDYALSSDDKVVILAFNAAPSKDVQEKAKQKKVTVQSYDVIYALLDDVQAMMEEKLPPKVSWTVLGEAEVLKRFEIDARKGSGIPVAGSKVLDGVIKNGSTARILRNEEVIWEGLISSIRHLKDEVSETKMGMECGISFGGFGGFEIGDTISCVEKLEEKRSLYDQLEE